MDEMKRKPIVIKVEDVFPDLKGGRRNIDKFMAEIVNEPVVVKPEEVSPSGDGLTQGICWRPPAFPGLDSLVVSPALRPFETFAVKGEDGQYYLAKKPSDDVRPWERVKFLDCHFELVDWRRWWRSLSGPMPGLQWDTDPASVSVYRLSDKPLMVAVIRWHRFDYNWDINTERIGNLPSFYRLMWRLWWRKVDPTKDAKLRAILEGAVALDALAGREP